MQEYLNRQVADRLEILRSSQSDRFAEARHMTLSLFGFATAICAVSIGFLSSNNPNKTPRDWIALVLTLLLYLVIGWASFNNTNKIAWTEGYSPTSITNAAAQVADSDYNDTDAFINWSIHKSFCAIQANEPLIDRMHRRISFIQVALSFQVLGLALVLFVSL